MNLIQEIEDQIKTKKLLKKGDSFVVGVSGGVDSIVLLYCLKKLSKYWEFRIHTAHLNHGLRKDSGKDEKFVKSLAKKYGILFISKKVQSPGSNVEEAGRLERYRFFEEVRKATKSKYILTAHNLNDNAETVILNLTRGAGFEGLSGMREKEGSLIRPLLGVKRTDVIEFAKKNKLTWREDPSNKSLKFARNRVRHRVLPELKKVNEKVLDNIVRSASLQREIYIELENDAQEYLKKYFRKGVLDTKKLKTLKEPLKKEILREAIRATKGNLTNIEKSHLEEVLKIIKKEGSKEISLPSGLIAFKEYDKLKFEDGGRKEMGKTEKLPFEIDKKILFSKYKLDSKRVKSLGIEKKDSVYVDVEKTGNLFVRSREDGDRVSIAKNKNKKLKDIFIDSKVPKRERDLYPVVVSEKGEVVWVPNLRLSHIYKATNTSKNIICIKVKKNEK